MAENRGLRLFYLRPKHHYIDHLSGQVARTCINPRKAMSCFSDESFLGSLKKVGIACHKGTMCHKMLRRYSLHLELRWREGQ